MARNDGTIMIEDAELLYRNFSGIEGMYNPPGSRNFCVVLDPELAKVLTEDGWNVKYTKVREEGDTPTPYLQVQLGFKFRPPRVVMITSKGRTDVPEDLLGLLDWVDVAQADLIIRPRPYNMGGREGIKAYLKSLYLTVAEDALEQKYADVEEYQIDPRRPMLEITAGGEDEFIIEPEDIQED